jgi:hypothetical protein
MTRNQEMISSLSSIPVRVLAGYYSNIVLDQTLQLHTRECNEGPVDIVNDIGHADRE